MPIFKPIDENDAKGIVKEIYDEIKKVRQISKIPNFWKSLANNPETLERTWTSLQQVMKQGALDPVVKELIYVAVSVTNGCVYCIKSHSLAAKKKGKYEGSKKDKEDGFIHFSDKEQLKGTLKKFFFNQKI